MRLPRDLCGRDLARVLCARWAYTKVNEVGSHIILQTETPRHHRVSVPNHKPLRIGTLNAILREVAVAKGITREDILATL
ncbi:MAG: type II toxin-antitoxin system HicA family toxin [Bryobacterales bacterium]|nr:type II toxin-antitoxin system HicA family toxin [Opitutaceae bacterium]MCZ2153715.1 type II toxin-antitoxin system HicA family toxin [Bryobacterales bacterium]